jgi:hypothetical protein
MDMYSEEASQTALISRYTYLMLKYVFIFKILLSLPEYVLQIIYELTDKR